MAIGILEEPQRPPTDNIVRQTGRIRTLVVQVFSTFSGDERENLRKRGQNPAFHLL